MLRFFATCCPICVMAQVRLLPQPWNEFEPVCGRAIRHGAMQTHDGYKRGQLSKEMNKTGIHRVIVSRLVDPIFRTGWLYGFLVFLTHCLRVLQLSLSHVAVQGISMFGSILQRRSLRRILVHRFHFALPLLCFTFIFATCCLVLLISLGVGFPYAFPLPRTFFVAAIISTPLWGFCMSVFYLVRSFGAPAPNFLRIWGPHRQHYVLLAGEASGLLEGTEKKVRILHLTNYLRHQC